MDYDYDNIFIIQHPIIIDNKEYIEGTDITNGEFFQRIDVEDIIPSTSQPSLGSTVEICEEIKRQGYTDIIYIPISKGISSTYNSIIGSLNIIEGINIVVIDTLTTSAYLAYMVLEAARLVKEKESITAIVNYIYYLRDHMNIYFLVNDLKYLIKNGRLSNASGFVGNLLRIKPILEFDKAGRIVGTDKIRTTKKAIQTIINHVLDETKAYKKVQYLVCHGFDLELLEHFKKELEAHFNIDDFLFVPLSAVIGAHVGNGVVSLGYFILDA